MARPTVLLGLALLVPLCASAQFTQDRLTIGVDVAVSEEADGFIYEYTLTNTPESEQPLQSFILVLDARAKVSVVGAPEGWTFARYANRPLVGWAATGGIVGSAPVQEPFPASPFQLAPGESLGGFKIKSPFPASDVTFFAQGYAAIPVVDDIEDLPAEATVDFTERAFSGTTLGPESGSAPECGPQGGDSDADGVCERDDNCRFVENADQKDSGGLATSQDPGGTSPDGVGDLCQCGDLTGDGRVTEGDVGALQAALLSENAPVAGALKCNVTGPFSDLGFQQDCDLLDVVILIRAVGLGRALEALQACRVARP